MEVKTQKLWKHLPLKIMLVALVIVLLPLLSTFVLPPAQIVEAQSPPVARLFSPPLGYRDGLKYGPRITYDNGGILIENTDYGVKNPDLQGNTCFGVDFSQLFHAGEDWYREDGNSTQGAEVTAVADGKVLFADPTFEYPGRVVIIEHTLSSGQKVYSMYGHIDRNSLSVSAGQIVSRGERLGTVMYQPCTGRYPEYHPSGDDSHLHFEIRYFYDGSNIYDDYPACNGIIPGRGYTYPEHPDDFPSPSAGYTDPTTFVQNRLGSFLPFVLKHYAACTEGGELIRNGDFETGPPAPPWIQYSNVGNELVSDYVPHGGTWGVWLGGFDNAYEEIHQNFVVPENTSRLTVSFYVVMGSDDSPSAVRDHFYARLQNEAGQTIATLGEMDNTDEKWVWGHWIVHVDNAGALTGQSVRLSFLATNDGNGQATSFWLDDASITSTCGTGVGSLSVGSTTYQLEGKVAPRSVSKPFTEPSNAYPDP